MCRGSRLGAERPWTPCKSEPNPEHTEPNCSLSSGSAHFLVLILSEGKAMELFRKLREKPRGLSFCYWCICTRRGVSHVKLNLWFPFLRPKVSRRQSGGGASGVSGCAVLREEAQRFLHTPQVRHT